MRKISDNQILNRIRFENPWWISPELMPESITRWKPRPYLELFHKLIVDRSIQRAPVLMGPRRVGKTVMLHHCIQKLIEQGVPPLNICYVSVDHPIYNELSLEQFFEYFKKLSGTNLREIECFLFFDEIQ